MNKFVIVERVETNGGEYYLTGGAVHRIHASREVAAELAKALARQYPANKFYIAQFVGELREITDYEVSWG